ncbi:uncharacterized protein LY89DRAFT_96981 [Mollisia scopiformis]|uniref:BTB domain-containing protein n=1 Tax=Mollisia scopiformis TaxID=149040 RepID=A0A194X7P0_MOLSC|nr:uncharacterized protein LY89DRAFT_96981 [Mollisia scopiformis]KUJ15817.1 hypothetical protein LY89DRAFT_96981 [Mollisia scopiformis]
MRVNHKMVMQASPVFKTMLKHTFLEGNTLYNTGRVEVPLPEDDPIPFGVLMDIIHGRDRWSRVPRQVDLAFLTRLSILVDKYELLQAVSPFVREWFENLRLDIPQAFGPDITHWLCVSWVFRRPDEFNHVTRIAERESNGMDLDSYSGELKEDLPIPQRVLEEISRRRETAIRRSYEVLDRNIDMLQSGSPRCTSTRHEPHRFTCDAVLLGSLLESSSKLGIWPPPEAPYFEVTFKNLMADINQINLTSFCTKMGYTNQSSNSHGMKTEINAALGKVRNRLSGLNMRDFE